MSYTRAQLVTQALDYLGVIAEGQAPSDGDASKMDGYVNAAMQMLTALQIYYVSDFGQLGPTGGNIEEGAFLPLSAYLAFTAAQGFSQPLDASMIALEQWTVATLRTIGAPPRARAKLRVDPALTSRSGSRAIWPNNG